MFIASLGVVGRGGAEVGEEDGLATGRFAFAFGLDSDKDRIDLCEHRRVVGFEHPAADGFIIHGEHAQAERARFVFIGAAPDLEDPGFAGVGLLIQIKGHKK